MPQVSSMSSSDNRSFINQCQWVVAQRAFSSLKELSETWGCGFKSTEFMCKPTKFYINYI